ncbi:CesT family type III secretion system chaperone [Paraburkholderia sp. CI3]|uniref:CesT family type III secretion system chaperone n=1 Tax=Paraburkholderia sp. CI3 TaxID=2991060 RepID=UPI003D1AC95E
MTWERFTGLVTELCEVVGLPDPNAVIDRRMIEVEGFDVMLDHVENDVDAMYMNFHYGTVTAGRTLVIFRLLLEANLLVYAQDQAQLGLDSDTGGIVLIVRIPFGDDVTGEWLGDLLSHYAEHGRYWRKNILESTDEMFEGIGTGQFVWIRS